MDGAMAESRRLNDWIEAVLASRPSGRMLATADRTEVKGTARPKSWPGRGGAGRGQSAVGRQPGRREGMARRS
jgi:ATP-dependent RNA helicase SUPV3L1/SUV3